MAGGGEDSFIQPLGLLLGLTAILALLLSYLGQSTIIAFILVGVIVSLLGVEVEATTLGHISEVGILILLFMAGLEVDLGAFLKNWRTAAIIGVGQVVVSTCFFGATSLFILPAIGAAVNMNSAVYFGLCLCFSSTILVLGYLKSSKSMGTLYGQLCLGTLVLQDAASVLGIAVLGGLDTGQGTVCQQANPVDCPAAGDDEAACASLGPGCVPPPTLFARRLAEEDGAVASSPAGCADACAGLAADACASLSACVLAEEGDAGGRSAAVSVLVLFGKLVATIVVCCLLNRFVLRRLFEMFARSLELLYLGALGYATGFAALAVTAGFSGEIAAFLAGVSISQLPYKMHIETKMEPIKTLGVAIFFITLGLQLELGREMVEALPIGCGLAIFTLVATLPLFAALGYAARLKSHTVFMLGLLMNQISEFSLILCTLCVRAGVFEPVVLTVMTVAAVVSIVISSIGHSNIDILYEKGQRCCCLRKIDEHRNRGQLKSGGTGLSKALTAKAERSERREEKAGEKDPALDAGGDAGDEEAPVVKKPKHRRLRSEMNTLPVMEESDMSAWFLDKIGKRDLEQLEQDRKETAKELEDARESMSWTAREKRLHSPDADADADDAPPSPHRLYGMRKTLLKQEKRPTSPVIRTSHATDIIHGMIEGYVFVDHQLMFCTLRSGRMLFWRDQQDVGYTPPTSVWDISGMAIVEAGKESEGSDKGPAANLDASVRGPGRPWEWTITLEHIHRRAGNTSIEVDAVNLVLHGLEGQSDHDAQDWRDALAVATSKLNPIALRLAHIREELHGQRGVLDPTRGGFEARAASHGHRGEIICIGYNQMFPAVLALADAIGKQVVVVEYDPMKLNAIEELYSEKRRRQVLAADDGGAGDLEQGKEIKRRTRRIRQKSVPSSLGHGLFGTNSTGNLKGLASQSPGLPNTATSSDNLKGLASQPPRLSNTRPQPPRKNVSIRPTSSSGNLKGLPLLLPSASTDSHSERANGEEKIRGVKSEYADIHDPECWEELEMDQAFMVVCTLQGAWHAEKAILDWLKREKSETIFVACAESNVDAMRMYRAGAHFILQTDALAMRSTREILLETVATFGDCSQLVAAGLAHQKRLVNIEKEDILKFQYETG